MATVTPPQDWAPGEDLFHGHIPRLVRIDRLNAPGSSCYSHPHHPRHLIIVDDYHLLHCDWDMELPHSCTRLVVSLIATAPVISPEDPAPEPSSPGVPATLPPPSAPDTRATSPVVGPAESSCLGSSSDPPCLPPTAATQPSTNGPSKRAASHGIGPADSSCLDPGSAPPLLPPAATLPTATLLPQPPTQPSPAPSTPHPSKRAASPVVGPADSFCLDPGSDPPLLPPAATLPTATLLPQPPTQPSPAPSTPHPSKRAASPVVGPADSSSLDPSMPHFATSPATSPSPWPGPLSCPYTRLMPPGTIHHMPLYTAGAAA